MFLVLDHNQPNPLFRAPIGDSPKVNLYRGDSRLDDPLITQNRIFWTSEPAKGVGQCKLTSTLSKKETSNRSLVTLPISIRQVLGFLI
jgi:hypothetical protein